MERQAFADLKARILEVVTDPDRASEAVGVVIRLEQDLADLRRNVAARKQRIRAMNADYDTTRSELEAFLASIELEVRDHRQTVSATHKAMLASVTAEERDAIRRSHTKAMNSAIATIQSI
jgi:hypothetical protein